MDWSKFLQTLARNRVASYSTQQKCTWQLTTRKHVRRRTLYCASRLVQQGGVKHTVCAWPSHPSQRVSATMTSESSHGNQLRPSSHSTDRPCHTQAVERCTPTWWLRHHSLCVARIDETASSVQDWSRGQNDSFQDKTGLQWQSSTHMNMCVFIETKHVNTVPNCLKYMFVVQVFCTSLFSVSQRYKLIAYLHSRISD